MADLLITGLNDAAIARLTLRARQRGMSVEALARDILHEAAQLSLEEKRALAIQAQELGRKAMVPGVPQTPGWKLIREDRDSR
jgi:plasmid stability protein